MARPAPTHQPAETPPVSPSAALILVDSRCPQIAALAAGGLHPLDQLGSSTNPLQVIGDRLQAVRQRTGAIRTLHLLAHGRPGALRLGDVWIDTSALIAAADQLAFWQLDAIALWSCEVGADPAFVALLAELTGAQVWSTPHKLYRHADGRSQLALHHPGAGQPLGLEAVIRSDLLHRITFQLDALSLMTTDQLISAERADLVSSLQETLLGVDQRLQAAAASSEEWLLLLSGVFTAAGADLAAGAEALRQQVLSGGLGVSLDLRSNAELQGAQGAYSAATDRIYLNADWATSASSADVQKVLLEELGHALDQRLSGGADSAGDEGALFAARVLGTHLEATALSSLLSENDAGSLSLDGQSVSVEFAAGDADDDGVPDTTDLDDDNDGITDIEEQRVAGGLTFTPQTLKFNYAQNTSGGTSQHDAAGTYLTGDRNDPYFLFDGDINTEQRVHANDVYEFGLPATIGAGGTFSLTEGSGSNDAKAAVLGSLGTTDANGNTNNAAGGGQGWKTISARFGVTTVAELETKFIANGNKPLVSADGKGILFYAGPSDATKTFTTTIPIDNIQIVGLGTHGGWSDLALTAQVDLTLDTDKDGIPNNRDLDSDNDGISDLYEAVQSSNDKALYLADANQDGVIDSAAQGGFDANGLWKGGSVVPADTDADGIADFLDLDSDADGIPDTVEARPSTNFATNDGDVRNDDADSDGVIGIFDTKASFGGSFGTPVNTDGNADGNSFQNFGKPVKATVDKSVDNISLTDIKSILTTGDGKYAKLNNKDDALVLDMGALLPAGSVITIVALIRDLAVDPALSQTNALGANPVNPQTLNVTAKDKYQTLTYTLSAASQYIQIKTNGVSKELRIDSVTWGSGASSSAPVPDYVDTNSDTDDILDIDESGLILTGLDANGDGLDDGVSGSYTDPDGNIAPATAATVDLTTTGTLLVSVQGAGRSVTPMHTSSLSVE